MGIAWLSNQTNNKLGLPQTTMHSNLVIQQMLHFSKNMVYNLCYEVLEESWTRFYSDVRKAQNFTDVIHLHNSMLDNCLERSLLTNQNALKKLNTLNIACLQFSKVTTSFNMNVALPWTDDEVKSRKITSVRYQ